MSSKVGGIARAPVWGANPFLNNNNNNNNNNNVEEKKTYGYELRVTLHHCNRILYTVRKCNN